MATARKQSSGMWRVRVYSHTTADGKEHAKSFTAPTKQEAEMMASDYMRRNQRDRQRDMTVMEALEGFIDARSGVLSPSTLRGYRSLLQYFGSIGSRRLSRLTSAEVQKWISDLAGSLSPKSVSNVYGLLSASVALYAPNLVLRVKLPTRQKKRPVSASDDEIAALYQSAPTNLRKAIALAAFTSMRRGEICALTFGDITGNTAHIHADMVKGTDGWYTKPTPKTSESDRFVRIPDPVLNLIGTGAPDERVVPITPDTITECFGRLRDKLGIAIRFHDLRHYFASIAAVLDVPDTYTESMGGWRPGSKVMKEVYQNRITPEAERYASKMADHFTCLIENLDSNLDSKN